MREPNTQSNFKLENTWSKGLIRCNLHHGVCLGCEMLGQVTQHLWDVHFALSMGWFPSHLVQSNSQRALQTCARTLSSCLAVQGGTSNAHLGRRLKPEGLNSTSAVKAQAVHFRRGSSPTATEFQGYRISGSWMPAGIRESSSPRKSSKLLTEMFGRYSCLTIISFGVNVGKTASALRKY